jgi:hypothetical protein
MFNSNQKGRLPMGNKYFYNKDGNYVGKSSNFDPSQMDGNAFGVLLLIFGAPVLALAVVFVIPATIYRIMTEHDPILYSYVMCVFSGKAWIGSAIFWAVCGAFGWIIRSEMKNIDKIQIEKKKKNGIEKKRLGGQKWTKIKKLVQ